MLHQLLKVQKTILPLLVLAFCSPLFGQSVPLNNKLFQIEVGPLITKENFRWSIAGNEQGSDPNVLSELRYRSLQKTGLRFGAMYQLFTRFRIQGTISQLYTYKGSVTDIDYAADNRKNPTIKLEFGSKKGTEKNYGLQLDYLLLKPDWGSIYTGAGYRFSESDYYMNGQNKKDNKGIYNAKWYGPFISVEIGSDFTNKFGMFFKLDGQYHQYTAEADWVLRTDFKHPVSFTHAATGIGLNPELEAHFRFSPLFQLQLKGFLKYWKTGHGIDRLYMVNSDVLVTQMNESVKKQVGLNLNGIFSF